MNKKRLFLRKNIFICLYSDILKQNLIISKIAIYHTPCTSRPSKKVHISDSPISLECVKKNYVNKMKLKRQNCLKQKIYRTERKFIKLREEAKNLSTGIMMGSI